MNFIHIDELVDIVSGKTKAASDRRSLAASILKYVQQQRTASVGKSEFERQVDEALLTTQVWSLWMFAEPRQHGLTCSLTSVKGEDGVERLRIKKDWGESEIAPTLSATPLAVPAPVITPSDEEKKAIAEMSIRLSPAETARKLISIEKDAAQAKANLSAVDAIEQEIANEKDTREKYEAAQQRLAELKSRALKQVDLGTF